MKFEYSKSVEVIQVIRSTLQAHYNWVVSMNGRVKQMSLDDAKVIAASMLEALELFTSSFRKYSKYLVMSGVPGDSDSLHASPTFNLLSYIPSRVLL
jgi:hypothetical protein